MTTNPATEPAAKPNEQPRDQAVRNRIKTDIDKTLFVEAGAGTGKTTSLVARIMSLITGPELVPISQIAAITFTEKAATELRNRIRAEISQQLAQIHPTDAPSAEYLNTALDGLDGAAISTLHGFARRLLDEHPLEVGLPPSFEVLDEITNQVMFDASWNDFINQILTDDSNKDWLTKLDLLGVRINDMQTVALKFTDNWDLLGWPGHLAADEYATRTQLGTHLVEQAQQLYELRSECADPADVLYAKFETLPGLIDRLKACKTDIDRLAVLTRKQFSIPKPGKVGKKDNWSDVESVRTQFGDFRESCEQFRLTVSHEATLSCIERLRQFALQLAEDRQSAGRLNFQDLLVICRDLLRSKEHGVDVRKSLHDRYTHLLLDEFHDTDPIQIEIAALIAASPTENDSVGDWTKLKTKPGHLFFVGDPKQSIYRFRRADIELYHRARERFGRSLGETLSLDVNFRSSEPIIDWVNHTFETLMDTGDDGGLLQAGYTSLHAVRPAPAVGAPVTFLGASDQRTGSVAEVRVNEAKDVAGTIVTVCEQGWTVFDKRLGKERPAHLDDITILIPSRAALPYLEDALEERQIPYRLESTSFVWANRVIRDLMMCLRAISDPTNELATVSALRSPIYGCGDDDLFRHKAVNRGAWDYRLAGTVRSDNAQPENTQSKNPVPTDDPVVAGLAHLNKLHDWAGHKTPAELIEQLIVERQVLEQATAWPGVREQWRHVRFLVDQARTWSESQQSGLRRFLLWANEQSNDNARVTIPVLPEFDGEAVHVMTMHSSKGLEFPVVILAGLQETVRKRSRPGSVGFFSESEPPAVRLLGDAKTSDYDEWSEVEVLADHYERVRKLYVACTRARDHLVVSVHRSKANPKKLPSFTSSQLLLDANMDVLEEETSPPEGMYIAVEDFAGAGDLPKEFLAQVALSSNRPAPKEWEQARERAVTASERSAWLSASSIAKISAPAEIHVGLDKGEDENVERAPHTSHYGGATFGSTVHSVLELLDLAEAVEAVAVKTDGDESDTGDFDKRLVELAQSCANAKGVPDSATDVEQRVRAVLANPTVVDAARSRHWQEIYVGTLAELAGEASTEVVIDGFVDLLYEDPVSSTADNPVYVVLDFKTSSATDEAHLVARTAGYLPQGAAYAYCVQRATGATVSRVEFAYLTKDSVQIHTVEGDALAMAIEKVVQEAQQLAGG